MEFTNRIQEIRKAAKMSQTELASKLGVTQPTISVWETGEYSPDMKNIIALCELFSVTPNQLLGIGEDASSPLTVAPKIKGPYIACGDGDTVLISPEEENFLMKCLAKARSGQYEP
jgi:transcriptional regulator with XRE-family HTH domain